MHIRHLAQGVWDVTALNKEQQRFAMMTKNGGAERVTLHWF